MSPFSSLSKRAQTFLRPSLVLVSPTLEQMISRYSLKLMGLFLSLSAWMSERMKGFLLSVPRSSRALLISAGSMVPLPSSSKTSKVVLRSSQSSVVSLSFQVRLPAAGLAGAGAGALALDRLIRYVKFIARMNKIKIKFFPSFIKEAQIKIFQYLLLVHQQIDQ